MNQYLKALIIIISLLVLYSCSPKSVGYVTSTQNIPMLNDRNQGQIMGAIGLNHLEGQASFSPIKHFALMANGYIGNGSSTELGCGLYTSTKSGFVFEGYALHINSNLSRHTVTENKFMSEHINAEMVDLESKYSGYSGQLDLGYKIRTPDPLSGSFAIGVKYSQVHYDQFLYSQKLYSHWNEHDQQMTSDYEMILPQTKLNFLAISPTARIGIGPFQFMFQFSTHINLDNYKPNQNSFPLYSKNWLTIGIDFRINEGSIKRWTAS